MRSAYAIWQTQEAQVSLETPLPFWTKFTSATPVNPARVSRPRYAEETQAGAGHLGGLCPRGGELGWVEASQWQPHSGPPVGAGEAQPTSRCEGLSFIAIYRRWHLKTHVTGPFLLNIQSLNHLLHDNSQKNYLNKWRSWAIGPSHYIRLSP